MTACPTCGKPVDPLRARAVAVVDGKVVGFCSAGCAAEAGSRQSIAAAARAGAVAEVAAAALASRDSLPASSAAEGRRGSIASAKVRAPLPSRDSAPVIEILHEPVSGVVTSARDQRKAVPLIDTLDDARDRTTPDRASLKKAADGAAVAGERDTPDPVRKKRRQSKRDSMNAKAAWEWLDEEPAEPVDPRGSRYGQHTGRNIVITLLLLASAGGGAYLYYDYVYRNKGAGETRAAKSSEEAALEVPATPAPADAESVLSARDAVERARGVLRGYVDSRSQRIQRMAAQALARTGDSQSITMLATALAEDKQQQQRLDIAYALARAGDKRGFDVLGAAVLSSARRDVRLEAGSWLSRLGDKRAMQMLESFLEVTQLRLGVAEQLAYLADPKALDVLDQIRRDPKATPDEKARAVIALGNAGRGDVAEELRAMLGDPRNNAFAATALAGLHDEAAQRVLVSQLDIPSLRVAAARGLRRLAPAADASQWLARLVASLNPPAKDTEQIQVAEAILLLAGPPEWSVYP